MNPTTPPDPADLEWALQERAREEERNQTAIGDAARLNRYRLISRVLHEPLEEGLPQDFAATLAAASEPARARHPAVPGRHLAILAAFGVAYLVAMTTAAFLAGFDLTHAMATFDRPIILLAFSVALSQAVARAVGLMRLVRSPLHTGQIRPS